MLFWRRWRGYRVHRKSVETVMVYHMLNAEDNPRLNLINIALSLSSSDWPREQLLLISKRRLTSLMFLQTIKCICAWPHEYGATARVCESRTDVTSQTTQILLPLSSHPSASNNPAQCCHGFYCHVNRNPLA